MTDSSQNPRALPKPSEGIEVEPSVIAALLERDQSENLPFRLIDCREEDEFHLCHLPTAELIPLQSIPESAAERFGEPDPKRPLVIY